MPRQRQTSTVKDVAERAQVSLTTVHRVFNSSLDVRVDTRRRVIEAADALSYRPNAIAQSLRRKRSGIIGHIVHTIYPNPFFACVAGGVEERARACGLATVTCNTHASVQAETDYVELLLRQRAEAIIFTTPLSEDNVRRARDNGSVTCVIERPKQLTNVDIVLGDNYGGARDAVRYLLELGHRAIAFVGQQSNEAADLGRLEGYRRALGDDNLQPRPEWIRLPGLGLRDGHRAMSDLLELDDRPTAILFAGDLPAIGALQALWEHRYRVPDDVSIISIDDTLAASASPPLTAMAIPMWEMGATAVDLVVRRMRDQPEGPVDRVVLPMRLVVRTSCRRISVRHSLPTNQLSSRTEESRTGAEQDPTIRQVAS
jgi:DNA-binding LacI/PurR family transcriptional regulator